MVALPAGERAVTRRGTARRLIAGNRQTVVGLCALGAFALIALLAPVIAPTPVNTQFANGFATPTPAHPLGLDGGGFDVMSRLVHGAQTSLMVGLIWF